MDWKLLKGITFCIGIVALVIALGTPSFAGKRVPPLQLIIEIVDFQANIIHIYGENFDNGDTPVVTLGGTTLTVQSNSNTEIQAILPVNTPGGNYLLKVVTGTASTQNDKFNVAIGAVITTTAHGRVNAVGEKVSGTNFSSSVVCSDYCYYNVLLLSMTNSTKGKPTCVVSIEDDPQNHNYPNFIQVFAPDYPTWNEVSGSWEVGILSYALVYPSKFAHATGFSFICVQE